MDTLTHLADHAGEVVSAQELIDTIWRGRLVYEAQIYKAIGQLRQAFIDLGIDSQVIETIPKRGYRLTAAVGPPVRASPHAAVRMSPGLIVAATSLALAVTIGLIVARQWSPQEWSDAVAPGDAAVARDRVARSASIAVLPFENLSPNPDDDYFAAGIHEEILSHLAKLHGLKVVDRSVVMPYAKTTRPLAAIAAELGVENVLVGSVRYADNQVRISPKLISVADGVQLWSETYEHAFEHIFAIQTQIATRVAAALERDLNLDDRRRLERQSTQSVEAFLNYVRAGPSDFAPGVPLPLRHLYLDRAIALDPAFAHAYARKANIYALSLVDSFAAGAATSMDLAELEQLARSNAEKALSLDAGLGPAHLALARLHQYRWRWPDAAQAYERALRLNPDDIEALRLHALFNSHCGYHVEAIRLATRAVDLAPSQAGLQFRLGTVYLFAGNLDSAASAFRAAIELDATYLLGHVYFALAEVLRGNDQTALSEFEIAEALLVSNALTHVAALTAYGYARIGHDEDAARIAREVGALATERPLGAGTWTLLSLAAGNSQQALAWLASASVSSASFEPDVSYHSLMLVKTNALRDPVLDEAEFRAARQRIGCMDR